MTIDKRLARIENRLNPPRRHRMHVIDATHGDPDALTAAYEADTPRAQRARNIITLIDATIPKETT